MSPPRVAHFAMGVPLALGGWAEARVRLGAMKRLYADMLIVPGLLFASFEIGLYHLDASVGTGILAAHAAIAIAGIVIAGLRLCQSMEPASIHRSLLISVAATFVGAILFLDALLRI